MAYENFKDLPRTTASDEILLDKAFSIVKNPKYYWYQRGLASMDIKEVLIHWFINFLIKIFW